MIHVYRDLRPLPLNHVDVTAQPVITMSLGQWDEVLASAYEQGWVLLELDEQERPVRAYQKRPDVRDNHPDSKFLERAAYES